MIFYRFLIVFLLFFIGCEELPDLSQNPFEAEEEAQVPQIVLMNDSINGNEVMLNWSGNKFALEYSYQLSYYDYILDKYFALKEWSEWSLDSTLHLTSLDEGDYRFYIKTHFNYEKENIDSLNFKIDNILNNSIRIFPLIKEVNTNQDFYIEVFLEEVLNLAAVTLNMNFYSSDIQCENFVWGSVINEINFSNESISITPHPIIDQGSIKIDVAFSGNGFSGTGALIKLIFSAKNNWNETGIFIQDAFIFDTDGNEIMINEIVNGILYKIDD